MRKQRADHAIHIHLNPGKACRQGRHVTWRPAGYKKRVPQLLNFGGQKMYFDDQRLRITEKE